VPPGFHKGAFQQRQQHRVIVNLIGKADYTRTAPMPDWSSRFSTTGSTQVGLTLDRVFRRVNRAGSVWGDGITERLSGMSALSSQREPGSRNWRCLICVETTRVFGTLPAANWNRSSSFSVTSRSKPPSDTSGASSASDRPSTTESELSRRSESEPSTIVEGWATIWPWWGAHFCERRYRKRCSFGSWSVLTPLISRRRRLAEHLEF